MKIVAKVPAWGCGMCGALYPFNDEGKKAALSCCLCSRPGCKNRSMYIKNGGICRACLADKELVEAQDNLRAARERVHQARQVKRFTKKIGGTRG
jgi:hypothetical protein